MAESSLVITCPECKKKFKGKSELQGKKIRCPLCSEPFLVTADLLGLPRGEGQAKGKAAPGEKSAAEKGPATLVPAAEKKVAHDDLDADANPYVVTEQDLKIRCPNCAQEMVDDKAYICIFCGYNTLTRQRGATKRTYAITFKDHLIHLLPALGALLWFFLLVLFVLWFCLNLPYSAKEKWYAFCDSEATRMWITIICVFQLYAAGVFGAFKLIFEPKPKEIEKE